MDKTARDYFISYTTRTEKDIAWAVWIEWVLRSEFGDCTIMQEYDFEPGCNFKALMDEALRECKIVICVLSREYEQSANCTEEWSNANRFIPVLIEDFSPSGLLKNRSYIKLCDLSEDVAKQRLIEGMKKKVRPRNKPPFPNSNEILPFSSTKPDFPGFAANKTCQDIDIEESKPYSSFENEKSDLSNFAKKARSKRVFKIIVLTILPLALLIIVLSTREFFISANRDKPVFTNEMIIGDWVTATIGNTRRELISFAPGGVGLFLTIMQNGTSYDDTTAYGGFYWELYDNAIRMLFPYSPWSDDVFEYTHSLIDLSDDGDILTMFRQVFRREDLNAFAGGSFAYELGGTWSLLSHVLSPLPDYMEFFACCIYCAHSFSSLFEDEITLFPNGTGSTPSREGGIVVFRWFTLVDNLFLYIHEHNDFSGGFLIEIHETTLTVFDRDGTVLTYKRQVN